MKIGILTYHRVINKGALLQLYCSVQRIQDLFPQSQVEIIDYRPPQMERIERQSAYNLFPPWLYVNNIRKIYQCRKFLKNECGPTSKSIKTSDLSDATGQVKNSDYDIIFVGSDVIWEIREGSNVPIPPNLYYLPDIDGPTKVSFSASADRSDPELISEVMENTNISELTQSFDFISVRDQFTKDMLVNFGHDDTNVHYMCDPTLLYDFSDLIEKVNINSNQPIAGMEITDSSARAKIEKELLSRGFEVFQFYGDQGKINSYLLTINEKLGLYHNFDLHITDRFHGSIFGLTIAECPTMFVERGHEYPPGLSKGQDLFDRIGISDFVWRYEGQDFKPEQLDILQSEWDHRRVDNGIKKIISQSEETIEHIRTMISKNMSSQENA